MRAVLVLILAAAVTAAEPAALAAELDALIDADLAARKVQPLPQADAATLVRRAWIDLGGRIPTADEAVRGAGQDRQALLASVIASPAWRQATFSWLADVLRVQSRLQDRTPGIAWIVWLRTGIRENMAWDAMARAMLASSGPALAPDGGPAGFTLRDAGMPLDHAAIAAQTFLGTRIGCAQCHDHPFDRWTRMEFLRYAAFSADARTQLAPPKAAGLRGMLADAAPELRQSARAVANIVGARVEPARKDWIEIPKDWEGPGAKPGDHVSAQVLFGPAAPAAAGDPRQRLAAWMASADNPRFALAIGNRIWRRVFGYGLIEPVDDIRGDPAEALPPLQARLARLVVECGYDLQRIHLVLCLTRHWGRAAWIGELPERGGIAPGRPASRLSATAWWDSLVALAIDEPDLDPVEDLGPLHQLRQRVADGGADAILEAARRLSALRKGGAKAAAADDQQAVAAAADQLLASVPAAEHQARIWLDAARYADT
ncbi:MAG: DUF1549 domain-containing protein, partial [Planctomycetes bacterium]|nr:DUF1549 domain-containing protein [Planctomycetota bacterium]